jgi:undecaprenyl-diphosphatase
MQGLGTVDQELFRWFQDHQTPALNAVVVNLTDLGHRHVVMLVALLAAVCFLALRRPRPALLVLAAAFASWALVVGIKRAVERPRPSGIHRLEPSLLSRALGQGGTQPAGGLPEPTHTEKSYSFPSGHALSSGAIYLTVALLAARRLRRRRLRVLVVVGTALLVFVIGLTRLYLGVHYFSDVIAGWAGGLGVALLWVWLDEWWAAPREARPA